MARIVAAQMAAPTCNTRQSDGSSSPARRQRNRVGRVPLPTPVTAAGQPGWERLPRFTKQYDLDGNGDADWQCLHAGAGVAFVHAHFPADLALRLSYTCSDWAKAVMGDLGLQRSCLQFHAALDSAADDFRDVFQQQLSVSDGRSLTAGPCLTRRIDGDRFATLGDLDALRDVVAGLPRRGWREIARLVHERDEVPARRRFERQLQILDSKKRDTLRAALARFGNGDGIWSPGPPGMRRTPVQDVDVLIGLERRFARAQDSENADA